MDYSSGSEEISESAETFEEPEIVDETTENMEPEFSETEQEVYSAGDVSTDLADQGAIDQTPTPLVDQNPDIPDDTNHSQPKGIEVPGSPETEPIQDPSIRDWGRHSGGPEGGY